MTSSLRLGTRGSQLALYQANAVAALLEAHAGVVCEIVVIKTSGDRLADAALAQIGGKRLFVKEIEDALLAAEIDVAVHSSKDMPAMLPAGLDIGAVLAREDARDAIVLQGGTGAPLTLDEIAVRLGPHPRLGTSSVRRIAQLATVFPGASFLPIRGNLDTRLHKLESGQFDAIVLAAAGLRRLQHANRISLAMPVDLCVPAPGQGIIAIETRSDDMRVKALVANIDEGAARAALDAERSVVIALGGGCQMPLGAYAIVSDTDLDITAIVASLDGARVLRASAHGRSIDAAAVGEAAAASLLEQGAGEILAEVERALASVESLEP